MKNAVLALSLVCVGLIGLLYSRHSEARRQARESATTIQALSNEVSRVQTQLVMESARASDTRTNLEGQLRIRLTELAALSNRLQQARQRLEAAQKDADGLRADLQAEAARVAQLQGRVDELTQKSEQVKPLEEQITQLKSSLSAAIAERDEAQQRSEWRRVEKAELERKLLDPDFLQLQSRRLKDENTRAEKRATHPVALRSDPLARLELQPDGTVKLVAPTNLPLAAPRRAAVGPRRR